MRDFMWIEDTVDVILWLMQHPEISGLFNVGTGQARTYADVLRAVYAALDENRKWTLWICRPKSKGSINILPRPIFKTQNGGIYETFYFVGRRRGKIYPGVFGIR